VTAPQYPPTAQHGVRDGLLAAKDIEAAILGRPRRPLLLRRLDNWRPSGKDVLKAIIENYLKDNMAIDHMRTRLRKGMPQVPDPLADFSGACRIELQQFQHYW
jgi:hypothetical protein